MFVEVSQATRQQLKCVSGLMGISIMYGFTSAWSAPALKLLRSSDSPFNVTDADISLLAAFGNTPELVLVIIFGIFFQDMNRRYMIISSLFFFSLSYFVLIPEFGKSITILWANNFITSTACSLYDLIAFAYYGEVTSSRNRAIFSTVSLSIYAVSEETEYFLGFFNDYDLLNLFPFAVSLVFYVPVFYWLLDSPYQLIMQGKNDEAMKILSTLYKGESRTELEARYKDLVQYANAEKIGDEVGFFYYIMLPANFKICSFLFYVTFVTYSCGHFAFTSYAPLIMPKYDPNLNTNIMMNVCGVVGVFCAVISPFFADKVGRRSLMLRGFLAITIVQFFLTVAFWLAEKGFFVDQICYWIIGLISVLIVVFNLTVYPAVHILRTEVFPHRLKIPGSSILCVFKTISSSLFTAIYLPITNSIGPQYCYLIYSLVALTGAIFVYSFYEETRNMTLTEIQIRYRKKKDLTELGNSESDRT